MSERARMLQSLAAENPHLAHIWSGIGGGIVFSKKATRVAPAPAPVRSTSSVGVVPTTDSKSSTVHESQMNTQALERLNVFKHEPSRVVTDTTKLPTVGEAELQEFMIMNEIGKWEFNRDDAAAHRDFERMKIANDELKKAKAQLQALRGRTTSSAYSNVGSLSINGTPSVRGSVGRRRVSTLEDL